VAAVTEEYQCTQIPESQPAMKMRTLGCRGGGAGFGRSAGFEGEIAWGVEPDGTRRGFFELSISSADHRVFDGSRSCGRDGGLTLGDAVEMDVPADMPGLIAE